MTVMFVLGFTGLSLAVISPLLMAIIWMMRHREEPRTQQEIQSNVMVALDEALPDVVALPDDLEQRKAEELAKTYQDGFDSGFNFDPDEPDTESLRGGLATLLDFFNPDGEWRKRPSPEFLNETAVLMKAYRQGNRDGMAARARCQPQQLDLFQSTP